MPMYLVQWSIDIEADNPTEAAARALITQRDNDPDNTAMVFKVTYTDGEKYSPPYEITETIDLST